VLLTSSGLVSLLFERSPGGVVVGVGKVQPGKLFVVFEEPLLETKLTKLFMSGIDELS
jgi:hypothetical protein